MVLDDKFGRSRVVSWTCFHSPFEEEDLALEVPLAEVAARDDEVELVLVEGRLGLVDVAAGLGHALRQEVALQHREAAAEHVLRRGQVRAQELVCKRKEGAKERQ